MPSAFRRVWCLNALQMPRAAFVQPSSWFRVPTVAVETAAPVYNLSSTMCPICRLEHGGRPCEHWASALARLSQAARQHPGPLTAPELAHLVERGQRGPTALIEMLSGLDAAATWGVELLFSQPALMVVPAEGADALLGGSRRGPLAEAVQALFEGKPTTAVRVELERAGRQSPTDFWPRAWLGMLSLLNGDAGGACQELTESLLYAGTSRMLRANAHRLVARALFCLGDSAGAAQAIGGALEARASPELHYDQAVYSAACGRLKDLRRHLAQAIAGCAAYHSLARKEEALRIRGSGEPSNTLARLEQEARREATRALGPVDEALAYAERLGAASLAPDAFNGQREQALSLRLALEEADYPVLVAISSSAEVMLNELGQLAHELRELAAVEQESLQRTARGAMIGAGLGAGVGLIMAVGIGAIVSAAGSTVAGVIVALFTFVFLFIGGILVGTLRDWLR